MTPNYMLHATWLHIHSSRDEVCWSYCCRPESTANGAGLLLLLAQGKRDCRGCKLTFTVVQHSVKVLDVAEAVAAQLQAVGTEAQAIVANIKGALPAEAAPGWLMSAQCQPGSACP